MKTKQYSLCYSLIPFHSFYKMSNRAVDFENLMETSFCGEVNTSLRASVRPRWERKMQQNSESRQPLDGNLTNSTTATRDRFIPSRSGTNMELSKYQINRTASSDSMSDTMEEQKSVSDATKDQYATNLSSALLGVEDPTASRIISYKEKAPAPQGDTVNNLNVLYSASTAGGPGKKKGSSKLVNRHIPASPSRILDAPDLMDDYYLNLISWNEKNVLAVALGQTVYLWNAGTGDVQELFTFDQGPNAHISSVSWIQEGGGHLAVGVSSGETQLWDVQAGTKVRGMDGHTDRVGSLAWNRHILSSGSRDTTIVNHDVRIARHNTATLSCHEQEVCGLTWSPDGEVLASGGNDNMLCLWDISSQSSSRPRFRMTEHQAAVKALAWSPHDRNILASGGGTADRTIKFWNANTGALLNSIDTGSQVCALQWNPFEKEILSSHGYARNQLTLWKYPSMAKIKEFEGHTSRVLHLCLSPDGGSVLSAAADETLRFWDMFAAPDAKKSMVMPEATDFTVGKRRWTTQIR